MVAKGVGGIGGRGVEENGGRSGREEAPGSLAESSEQVGGQAEGRSGLRAASETVAVVSASVLVGGGAGMLTGVALGAINPFALGLVGVVAGPEPRSSSRASSVLERVQRGGGHGGGGCSVGEDPRPQHEVSYLHVRAPRKVVGVGGEGDPLAKITANRAGLLALREQVDYALAADEDLASSAPYRETDGRRFDLFVQRADRRVRWESPASQSGPTAPCSPKNRGTSKTSSKSFRQ